MRGAAHTGDTSHILYTISTHAPHARRGIPQRKKNRNKWISTHAPHARRGGTAIISPQVTAISTHAPHARRGARKCAQSFLFCHFYSRASCEARRHIHCSSGQACKFLLTRLMRGAAVQMKNWEKYEEISTHAPHARRGVHLLLLFHRLIDFYSRASCEARLNLSKSTFRFFDFYSRASCEARRYNGHNR